MANLDSKLPPPVPPHISRPRSSGRTADTATPATSSWLQHQPPPILPQVHVEMQNVANQQTSTQPALPEAPPSYVARGTTEGEGTTSFLHPASIFQS